MFRLRFSLLLLCCSCCVFTSCKNETQNQAKTENITPAASSNVIDYTCEVIDTLPHSATFYTQGLFLYGETMYEGTGQYAESKLVRYKKNKKMPDKIIELPKNNFGEGIAKVKDKLYQLTWLNQQCFVYDFHTLKLLDTLSYSGEGWGLTTDDSLLYMSDGSDVIRIVNPKNFNTIGNIKITLNAIPLRHLNEMELVDSLLYINIYGYDLIVIADKKTGSVVGKIDISPLRKMLVNNPTAEVSNGIAYDKEKKLFYITGKYWNKIFIVKFVPNP